jgi:hypothetical protein
MGIDPITAGIGATVIGGALQGSGTAKAGKESRKGQQYSADVQKQISEAQLAQQLAQLQGRETGQLEALGRAQDVYGAGTQAFMKQTEGVPQEVSKLQELIRSGALKEQQQAMSRGKLAQTQAGVRGPEAALMSQMQASEMGENLARAVEEVGLREALRRGQAREQFAQQQAMAGLGQALTPVERIAGVKRRNASPFQQGSSKMGTNVQNLLSGSLKEPLF